MLFKRYYDTQLAQASYLLACEASGEALVVDPNRDVDFYIAEAAREKVRISYVTETHIHADFVSGSRELAQKTNARLFLSDEGGDDWRYSFAAESGAGLLRDGDTISFGRVRVQAMHTPGHTPEHLAFLVTDLAVSPEPVGMLSGDFIFVGDVGRPDLLERAAKVSGSMESAARDLFQSLQKTRSLPDYLQIWPGHGAGSACGKALGSMPQTTLGYERISNWALRMNDEDTFVREALAGQPTPPRYFAQMKRVNKAGPAIIGGLPAPAEIGRQEVVEIVGKGGLVIDLRTTASFSRQHIGGALNIPFNKSFIKWAGSLLPYDRDVALLVEPGAGDAARNAARDLAKIGFERVRGFTTASTIQEWRDAGRAVESAASLSAADSAARLRDGTVNVLDVRDEHELTGGQVVGAVNIPLSTLPERIAEVPRDKPVVVYCEGGSRSAIAASLLRAAGLESVLNMEGGFTGWRRAGLPQGKVERSVAT